MPAYVVFLREGAITDPEAMAKYQSGNRDSTPDPNLKPLVVYGALDTLEGAPTEGVVILEFPDKAAARAWYDSEDYQARARLRMQAAPYRAFIVEGL